MLFHILARLLWPKWSLFANMWESMQVELHGIYSTARVLQLAKHERTSNWIHDIAILFGIPLPCVAVTVLIDVFPLADPTDSIDANTMSFKSPSIWTTLQITIADALLTVVSLRDIESARRGLKSLERRIDKKKGWGRFHNSAQNGRYLEQTTLGRASTLLQQNENQENTRISSTADIVRIASFCDRVLNDAKAEGEEVDTRKTVVMPKNMDPSSSLAGGMVRATGVAVHPISNDRTDIGSSNMSITLRYTCKVRRLLYMAEFLVLLNYVEVFIPLVFCKYKYFRTAMIRQLLIYR
ncbi:hypothetical protein L914_12343 [Phytophthora nicotianae]|uniref:Uncharacterized protein n=1 Tax=Phytophthora nicotianae TaxID=4792 RepID=W2N237_PHYNI|nr:hypothetical protein L914_12343 [Phytophthora nicotianae]